METAANKLQKEAKGYLDSLRAMTASQMRIAETIDAFYGDAGAKDGVSRSYKQAVTDLDAEADFAVAFVGGVVGVGHYPFVDAEDGVWFEDAEDLGVDGFEGGGVDGGFDGVGCVEGVFREVDFLGRIVVG